MPDYSVTIKLQYPITARNEEQAKERAEAIADSVGIKINPKWLGDPEPIETEVEEN